MAGLYFLQLHQFREAVERHAGFELARTSTHRRFQELPGCSGFCQPSHVGGHLILAHVEQQLDGERRQLPVAATAAQEEYLFEPVATELATDVLQPWCEQLVLDEDATWEMPCLHIDAKVVCWEDDRWLLVASRTSERMATKHVAAQGKVRPMILWDAYRMEADAL